MNEMAFGLKVAEHLSASARAVDPTITRRLRAARVRAIELHVEAVPRSATARRRFSDRLARWGIRLGFAPALRSAALAAAMLVLFVLGGQWAEQVHVDAVQAVDAALLIDDLPIEAYLDPEFRAWVARELQS